jgi:hypothetical protein
MLLPTPTNNDQIQFKPYTIVSVLKLEDQTDLSNFSSRAVGGIKQSECERIERTLEQDQYKMGFYRTYQSDSPGKTLLSRYNQDHSKKAQIESFGSTVTELEKGQCALVLTSHTNPGFDAFAIFQPIDQPVDQPIDQPHSLRTAVIEFKFFTGESLEIARATLASFQQFIKILENGAAYFKKEFFHSTKQKPYLDDFYFACVQPNPDNNTNIKPHENGSIDISDLFTPLSQATVTLSHPVASNPPIMPAIGECALVVLAPVGPTPDDQKQDDQRLSTKSRFFR